MEQGNEREIIFTTLVLAVLALLVDKSLGYAATKDETDRLALDGK